MRHMDSPARNGEQVNGEEVMHSEAIITSRVLQDAMSRVYIDNDSSLAGYDFSTRFNDIGMESLEIAELIVELEEILGIQLEIAEVDQLDTLGDLCQALRAAGELS